MREWSPRVPIEIVTSAPAMLFAGVVTPPIEVRALDCDVGLVQRDALVIDEGATVERWRAFQEGWEALCTLEADHLRRNDVRLVLGDVPPLAFAAAARAEVPSIALANFSWDWIYRHLSIRVPALAEAAHRAAEAYGCADLLLRLPFAGDLSTFPRIVDIPLVARRPRAGRGELRQRCGFGNRTVVLLSFGGLGLAGFDVSTLGGLGHLDFVVSTPVDDPPPNLRVFTGARLTESDLGYADLVGAADVVVTKPGYGIVTDALGARTRLIYTDRGDFPEYEILVRGMQRLMPCAYVDNESLRAGRLGGPIADVLEQPWTSDPDLSGASVAAEHLLRILN